MNPAANLPRITLTLRQCHSQDLACKRCKCMYHSISCSYHLTGIINSVVKETMKDSARQLNNLHHYFFGSLWVVTSVAALRELWGAVREHSEGLQQHWKATRHHQNAGNRLSSLLLPYL